MMSVFCQGGRSSRGSLETMSPGYRELAEKGFIVMSNTPLFDYPPINIVAVAKRLGVSERQVNQALLEAERVPQVAINEEMGYGIGTVSPAGLSRDGRYLKLVKVSYEYEYRSLRKGIPLFPDGLPKEGE